jgi:hypothetical protein
MADNVNESQEEQSSKYKNSRGVPWSDVPIGDLPGYIRDGIEAAKLLKAIDDKMRD